MIGYFLSALIIAFVLTPVTIKFAKKINLITDSSDKKHPAYTHKGILPRGGGFPIFLGILLPLLFFVHNKVVSYILLGAGLSVIIGLIDDRYDISPYFRFILNIFVACLAVLGGIGIPYISTILSIAFM